MNFPATAVVPPSLRWSVDHALDGRARKILFDRLDAVFTDANAPHAGWNRLSPDVVVLVIPTEDSFRVVAHWTEAPAGLPATSPDWVTEQVASVVSVLTGSPATSPELVPIGLGT